MKAKDIRKGNVILHKGQPYRVMEFHHHTPGNLRAMVQAKLRSALTGVQTEVRFSSTEDLEVADIFQRKATYLYHDANGYHFMDAESYEEVVLSDELVADSKFFIREEMAVEVSTYNGEPIGLTLPTTVVLTVVDTEPGLKGATASNSPKPATMDTGLVVSVPPFVKIGDKIVVNVEESKYLSRSDE